MWPRRRSCEAAASSSSVSLAFPACVLVLLLEVLPALHKKTRRANITWLCASPEAEPTALGSSDQNILGRNSSDCHHAPTQADRRIGARQPQQHMSFSPKRKTRQEMRKATRAICACLLLIRCGVWIHADAESSLQTLTASS